MEDGVERISSSELSARMKVTASQIRQDLNNFGGFGQQGYGYNVKYLYTEIAKILGIDRQHNLIIIGAGNLGQAIANYANFERRGFIIKGMFDVNPRLIGLVVRGIEIRGVEELEKFIVENDVQIAALTIPKTKAPEIADRLVKAGIKAIWNFAHTDLQVPDDVVVENVHLSESLMRLSAAYRIRKKRKPESWKQKRRRRLHDRRDWNRSDRNCKDREGLQEAGFSFTDLYRRRMPAGWGKYLSAGWQFCRQGGSFQSTWNRFPGVYAHRYRGAEE